MINLAVAPNVECTLPVTGGNGRLLCVAAALLLAGFALRKVGRRASPIIVSICLIAVSIAGTAQRADAAEICAPAVTSTVPTSLPVTVPAVVSPANASATTTTTAALATTTTTLPIVGGVLSGTYRKNGAISGPGVVADTAIDLREAGPDGSLDTVDDTHRVTNTNTDGTYSFGRVPAGLYRVTPLALPAVREEYSVSLTGDADQLNVNGSWGYSGPGGFSTTITIFGADDIRGTADDTVIVTPTNSDGTFSAVIPVGYIGGTTIIETDVSDHVSAMSVMHYSAACNGSQSVTSWSLTTLASDITVVADVDQTAVDFEASTTASPFSQMCA
jgi:hypothetical protein